MSTPGRVRRFLVRVILDEYLTQEDVTLDLQSDLPHGLMGLLIGSGIDDRGRVELVLEIADVDLWTSILTAMALIRQSGMSPHAVHATTHPDTDLLVA